VVVVVVVVKTTELWWWNVRFQNCSGGENNKIAVMVSLYKCEAVDQFE